MLSYSSVLQYSQSLYITFHSDGSRTGKCFDLTYTAAVRSVTYLDTCKLRLLFWTRIFPCTPCLTPHHLLKMACPSNMKQCTTPCAVLSQSCPLHHVQHKHHLFSKLQRLPAPPTHSRRQQSVTLECICSTRLPRPTTPSKAGLHPMF